MKVSIVIPAFNEEKNIADGIRAALAQDYPHFEVIVVDNGSTDNTAAIAAQFPITVIAEPRKGTNHARESGRRVATGENIDADCLPSPDWLSVGVARLNDRNVSAVSGPYDYYDAGRVSRIILLALQKNVFTLANKITSFLNRGGTIIAGNVLIRASALDEAGGYNTAIVFYGDDTDTAQRVSRHGKIIFDRRLIVRSSARRFKAEGTFKIIFIYVFYFFRITLANAAHKEKRK